jgi:hypothetical protein
MSTHSAGTPAALLFCMVSLPLATCALEAGGDDQAHPQATVPVTRPFQTEQVSTELGAAHVGVQLQHEITQVLWGCYAVGADLVGVGNVEGAKAVLSNCFAEDMIAEALMPPAYASLNFKTAGGAAGFVDVANQIYRSLNFTRTQHLITNIVIERTGPNTAIVHSSALAVHVYSDEHVFNATIKFVDHFQRSNGAWKITHKTLQVISVSQAAAWVP